MKKTSKIYIAGHTGMVGSAVLQLLEEKGYSNLLFASSKGLDLRNQEQVNAFFKRRKPEYVFLLAARVGGIKANIDYPAEFLYDNLMIEANVINASYQNHVKKLLFLGSSCIYPRNSVQPIKEEYLLSGKLEPTNEAYAIAKIAGLKLCENYNKQFGTNYICLMPTNLYGPGDNFDAQNSHVVAALIRKFVDAEKACAKSVEVWGNGKARREFLYVDDLAAACLYFMKNFDAKRLHPFINIGYGKDITIKELVDVIKTQTGYRGKVVWNKTMPNGMPRKLLDLSFAGKFHWKARTPFAKGIKTAIDWYRNEYPSNAKRP